MDHEPQVQQRAAQPYVAIRAHVATEAEFRRAADSGFPALFGWLKEDGVEPSGPLFIRYLLVDEDGEPREIELAVPVAAGVAGDGRVRADVLPAGRYLTLLHVGPYSSTTVPDLGTARAALQAWAGRHGIAYTRDTESGSALPGYVERYLTGPAEEPDHARWETELAYLTVDNELDATARAIIDANLCMTIATADDAGRPWASPVYYATADRTEFFWVSSPDATHSRNLASHPEVGIVIFDSGVPISTGQGVYMPAVAQELTAGDLDHGIGIFSRRSQEHGARAWRREDVQPPGRHRLYRATASEHSVLGPQDERTPVRVD